jgi:hypothetical protein
LRQAPSMSLDEMVRGIATALRAAATTRVDRKLGAGTLD